MKRPKFFPACNVFLTRIESGSYNGITSTLVLNEVLHKLIVAEAAKIYRLHSEQNAVNICSFDETALDMAVDLSNRHGLLISDASHLAVMKAQGITNIATNDSDFERVNGIDIYKP